MFLSTTYATDRKARKLENDLSETYLSEGLASCVIIIYNNRTPMSRFASRTFCAGRHQARKKNEARRTHDDSTLCLDCWLARARRILFPSAPWSTVYARGNKIETRAILLYFIFIFFCSRINVCHSSRSTKIRLQSCRFFFGLWELLFWCVRMYHVV